MQIQYNGIESYNTYFEVRGNEAIVKRYGFDQLRGYKRSVHKVRETKKMSKEYLEKEIENYDLALFQQNKGKDERKQVSEDESRERFKKSLRRAYNRIHEIVACNVGEHKDYYGNKQFVKFITLTFEGEMTDINEANEAFSAFMKRLSYYFYNVKKNVIKYVVVPELQKRGTWHFHVITFNIPFIKREDLIKVWGNGYMVGINAVDIDGNNGCKVASYVTKYLVKGVDLKEDGTMEVKEGEGSKELSNYDLYKSLGLENMKRFSASRGLKNAVKNYGKIDNETYNLILSVLCDPVNNKVLDKEGNRIKVKNFENEYRGDITQIVVRIKKKYIQSMKNMIAYLVMRSRQKMKQIIPFGVAFEKVQSMLERNIKNKYTRNIMREYEENRVLWCTAM